MRTRGLIALVAVLAGGAGPLAAQHELAAPCGALPAGFAPEQRTHCIVVAQAAAAAIPQLAQLASLGGPVAVGAGPSTLRLGLLPGVSASLRLGAAQLRTPDLRDSQTRSGSIVPDRQRTAVAPLLSLGASLAVTPGYQVTPTAGGVGALDLLGSVGWAPLSTLGSAGFAEDPGPALGVGVRLGLLREGFATPEVALTVMYHTLGGVATERACGEERGQTQNHRDDYTLTSGDCAGAVGAVGDFDLDVRSWSTRAAVGKRFAGLGLAAGLGYERASADVSFLSAPGADRPRAPPNPARYVRATRLEASTGRFSAFVNASRSLLLGSAVLEAGWMQGGDALPGFGSAASAFDPGRGTFFGSLGVRVAL